MMRGPPPPPGDELSEDEGDSSEAPCIDHRTDEDKMSSYTNKQLHGAKVLEWGSSSEASSLESDSAQQETEDLTTLKECA